MAITKKIFVFLFAVASTVASTQDTSLPQRIGNVWVSAHVNTRSPKVDSMPIDWWVGPSLELTVDSTVRVSMMWSRERDQGSVYEAYRIRSTSDYVSLDRLYDTEKSVDIYSASMHIPLGNWKVGYGYLASRERNTNNFNVFYEKEGLVSLEALFFDGPHKVDLKFTPDIKMWKRLFLTYELKLMYVSDNRWSAISLSSIDDFYESIKPGLKFSSGFTVKIKVK